MSKLVSCSLEGDMTELLEYIPLSTEEDLPRFFEFFERKIKEGEIEDYTKKYKATKNKVRSIGVELTKEQAKTKLNELTEAIKLNASKRSDQFAEMMAKFGGKDALCLEDGKKSSQKEKGSSGTSKPKKSSTSTNEPKKKKKVTK